MTRIRPELAKDIQKYGSFDFAACYNCGNCTAVCNLTDKNANFPRMMIRYSMLGMKEEILSSKELWLCYSCGDCSVACPRQAAPGDLMASLRRYSIAHYEKTGLTKLIFKSNVASILITLILSIVLGFFLLTIKPEMEVSRWIFNYIPYEVLHSMGLIAFAGMGISALLGVWSLWTNIKGTTDYKIDRKFFVRFFGAARKVLTEVSTMKRYRDCDSEDAFWKNKPNLVKPWFVHWSVMWGFIGLLLATILDFMFKDPSTNIWWPSRILGTIAGIWMVYGSSLAIYYRATRITRAYANSRLADWLFLCLLWLAGITGFWLELAVFVNAERMLNHVVFVVHILLSMQLVILFAFSKFAHAFYRPFALLVHFMKYSS